MQRTNMSCIGIVLPLYFGGGLGIGWGRRAGCTGADGRGLVVVSVWDGGEVMRLKSREGSRYQPCPFAGWSGEEQKNEVDRLTLSFFPPKPSR